MSHLLSSLRQFWFIAPILCICFPADAQDRIGLSVTMQGGRPNLTVTGAVGTICSVQYTSDLSQTNNWLELTNVVLFSNSWSKLDVSIPAATSRFYRVKSTGKITSTFSQHSYGTTPLGQDLSYIRIVPSNASGRKALLTFSVHGFEDAWRHDGYVLTAIADRLTSYYSNAPVLLNGWIVHIVRCANPDGLVYGSNNLREGTDGAFGRCTSTGKDINRNFSLRTSVEQIQLATLTTNLAPNLILDFHGWYNCYYGNSALGDFFARSFNTNYPGKPQKYFYVNSNGVMDGSSTLGGIFHSNTSITHDLYAEWASSHKGIPAALIEYPAPDFDCNGVFDATYNPSAGFHFINSSALDLLVDRTQAALNDLFLNY